jgi:hypothetical protein
VFRKYGRYGYDTFIENSIIKIYLFIIIFIINSTMTQIARFPYYASQAFIGVSTHVAVYQALNIDKVTEQTPIDGFPLEVAKQADATNRKLDTIYT